jgi:hypothetical protein
MRAVLVAGFALAGAMPVWAEPTDDEIAAFIEAVETIGCVVNDDMHAAQVEEATGFDDAKLGEIVSVLLTDGRAVVPDSMEGLRLTTAACR